jgi:hypothetical protein
LLSLLCGGVKKYIASDMMLAKSVFHLFIMGKMGISNRILKLIKQLSFHCIEVASLEWEWNFFCAMPEKYAVEIITRH